MEVNVKLKFGSCRDVLYMDELLDKIQCPMEEENCNFCCFRESCLKLQEIQKQLECAILNEE